MAGAQEAVANNLTRELETVHRDCRTLQRIWLSKQGELVTAQVCLPAASHLLVTGGCLVCERTSLSLCSAQPDSLSCSLAGRQTCALPG